DLVPRPIAAEASVTLPHRLPRPEALGQIAPGDPAAVAIDDALHHGAVIGERPATPAPGRRHQRSDQLPLRIGQQLSSRHTPSLSATSRNYLETRPRTTALQAMLLRAGHRRTIPVRGPPR